MRDLQANTSIPANSWGQYVAAMIEYFNVTGGPVDLSPPLNSSQVQEACVLFNVTLMSDCLTSANAALLLISADQAEA